MPTQQKLGRPLRASGSVLVLATSVFFLISSGLANATVSEFCQGTHTDGGKTYIDFAFRADTKVISLNVSIPDGSNVTVPIKEQGGVYWGSLETSGNGQYKIETFKGETSETSHGTRLVPGYKPFDFAGQKNVACPLLPAGAISAQAQEKAVEGPAGGGESRGGGNGLVPIVILTGVGIVVVGLAAGGIIIVGRRRPEAEQSEEDEEPAKEKKGLEGRQRSDEKRSPAPPDRTEGKVPRLEVGDTGEGDTGEGLEIPTISAMPERPPQKDEP